MSFKKILSRWTNTGKLAATWKYILHSETLDKWYFQCQTILNESSLSWHESQTGHLNMKEKNVKFQLKNFSFFFFWKCSIQRIENTYSFLHITNNFPCVTWTVCKGQTKLPPTNNFLPTNSTYIHFSSLLYLHKDENIYQIFTSY